MKSAVVDHEYYEKARKRAKQKRRLYFHFVLFLVGSVFFVVLNKVIKFHPEIDWYVWAIFVWFLLLILHTIDVFVMKRFFDKNWERIETEKLIQKHAKKSEKLEEKLEKSGAFDKFDQLEEKP